MTFITTKLNRACKSRHRILHLRVNILSFVQDEYIKSKNLASGSSIKVRPFNSIITRVLRTSDSTFITFYPGQQIYMEFAILSWQVTRFIRDISFITLTLIILKISSAIFLSLSLSRATYRHRFIMLICREKTWLFFHALDIRILNYNILDLSFSLSLSFALSFSLFLI